MIMSILKYFENDDKNQIMEITKKCTMCKKEFFIENFAISTTTPKKVHRRKICKNCHSKRQLDRMKIKKTSPKKSLKCDLCEKECKTVMDHCHTKLTFRGWLCNDCNTGLGMFYDNISTLQSAVLYLQKHQ